LVNVEINLNMGTASPCSNSSPELATPPTETNAASFPGKLKLKYWI
jgi:hypothetical protein